MIEDADAILLVGVNPRTEAPVLNSRILKAINKKKTKVYNVGTPSDLTYPYSHLGNSATTLADLASGQHSASQDLENAKLPLLIIGHDALTRADSPAILNHVRTIANKYKFINAESGWNGYNVLHRSQGHVNALELGIDFTPIKTSPKVIFLLGCDNNITPEDIPKDSFVVYIVKNMIFRDLTETKEHNMPISFSLLRPTLSELAPTSIPKAEYRWALKWLNLQVILEINGKSLEHCLKNAELPFPTILLKNLGLGFIR